MSFRFEICNFTGFKIAPGHGKIFVRGDSKAFRLINSKAEAHFLCKKNPRKFHWTIFYRKTNKKGSSEEAKKKRTRKVVKVQRAVVGASEEVILAKRNQPLTVRQSARDSAIKAAKEHKRKVEEAKKKAAAKPDAKALKAQQNKVAIKAVKSAKVKATSR